MTELEKEKIKLRAICKEFSDICGEINRLEAQLVRLEDWEQQYDKASKSVFFEASKGLQSKFAAMIRQEIKEGIQKQEDKLKQLSDNCMFPGKEEQELRKQILEDYIKTTNEKYC